MQTNSHETLNTAEAEKALRNDPVFGKEGPTESQIKVRATNDRIGLLRSQEAAATSPEEKKAIRAQINMLRRGILRTSQRDILLNAKFTGDEAYSKRAGELLRDEIDSTSAKNLLTLERTKRGSLSKFFAFRKSLDPQGLEIEEPLDIAKVKEGDEINIDFGGNRDAYWKVGLGDILPTNVPVAVVKTKEGVRTGVRTIRNGKIGYYDENGYIAIFTGDSVSVPVAAERDRILAELSKKNLVAISDESAESEARGKYLERLAFEEDLEKRLGGSRMGNIPRYGTKAPLGGDVKLLGELGGSEADALAKDIFGTGPASDLLRKLDGEGRYATKRLIALGWHEGGLSFGRQNPDPASGYNIGTFQIGGAGSTPETSMRKYVRCLMAGVDLARSKGIDIPNGSIDSLDPGQRDLLAHLGYIDSQRGGEARFAELRDPNLDESQTVELMSHRIQGGIDAIGKSVYAQLTKTRVSVSGKQASDTEIASAEKEPKNRKTA